MRLQFIQISLVSKKGTIIGRGRKVVNNGCCIYANEITPLIINIYRQNSQMTSNQGSQDQYGFVQGRKNTTQRTQAASHHNNQYFDNQHMLPLYSTNANSVNPNQLIFRAREIYEKYRTHNAPPTGFPNLSLHHPHQQIPHPNQQKATHGFDPNYGETSIKGSFHSEHQPYTGTPKNLNNEIKTAETVASITNILHHSSPNEAEKLKNFLYVMVGIFSCHIRVNQRFGLQSIDQYQRSVKKCTDFCRIILHVIRKKIKPTFTLLRLSKNANFSRKNPIQYHEKTKETKTTRAESPQDSNFAMEESTVEKGLKFLQQRSNQRKKLQQKMRNSQNTGIKKQQAYEQHPNLKQKQSTFGSAIPLSTYSISNSQQKNTLTFQFNHQLQKKSSHARQVIPSQVSPLPPPPQAVRGSKFSIPSAVKQIEHHEEQDIYLRLQRESKINKNKNNIRPSWLLLQLNQKPLISNYDKEIFDRPEISERKYYLNPSNFKEAEPDRNQGFISLLSNLVPHDLDLNQSAEDRNLEKKFLHKTPDANILEDTLPIFDPSNNQNATRSWEPPQKFIQQLEKKSNKSLTPNLKSIESSGHKNSQQDQRQFQNLPSFNEKNRINIKNEPSSPSNKKEQRQMNNQEQQQHQKPSGERSRRKSDFVGLKKQENSANLSEEDQQFTDNKLQKNHSQYFTSDNLAEQKKQNVRSSFDFVKNKKGKRPLSRPKSMTYSIGNNQANKKQKQQYFNQEKVTPNASQNTSSQNTELSSQEKSKPKIIINYQSPPKQVKMTSSINLGHIPPHQQFHQPPPRIIFQNHSPLQRGGPYFNVNQIQNYNHPINVNNKQMRAVSSQARFFESRPAQAYLQNSVHQNQINRPRIETNYVVNSPRNSPMINSVINHHTFLTGQQSLKLIRPAPIAEAYGLTSIRNIPQAPIGNMANMGESPQGFHKKKGIQLKAQNRFQQPANKNMLSRYSSDKRLGVGHQYEQRLVKAQVPKTPHQQGRKLKVVTAEYH